MCVLCAAGGEISRPWLLHLESMLPIFIFSLLSAWDELALNFFSCFKLIINLRIYVTAG